MADEAGREPETAGERTLDVLIVGAGPAGMAVAIAAGKRELNYEVVEKGALVNSIFHFPGNMVFFTTPDLLEIGGLPFTTAHQKPTRAEALVYYRRVADACRLRISLGETVTGITRRDGRPGFAVETLQANGKRRVRHSHAVVLATGYFDHPNRLGVPGEDLPHVSHYYTDPHPLYRKKVVVVGGRNSAAVAALEFYRAGASVILVHRGAELSEAIKYWIRPDILNRIREGSIRACLGAVVREIRPECVEVESNGRRESIPADYVFLLTGYHPDAALLRGAGVTVDETSSVPRHDPETLETDVPGIFLAGAIVAGRDTNRIFIENGRFHGEMVVRTIAERLGAAGNDNQPGI